MRPKSNDSVQAMRMYNELQYLPIAAHNIPVVAVPVLVVHPY